MCPVDATVANVNPVIYPASQSSMNFDKYFYISKMKMT